MQYYTKKTSVNLGFIVYLAGLPDVQYMCARSPGCVCYTLPRRQVVPEDQDMVKLLLDQGVGMGHCLCHNGV